MKEFLPQYAAQAVVDLERTAKDAKKLLGPKNLSVISMIGIAALIRKACHVVLPPNGEIYRSNHWGGDVPNPDEAKSFEVMPAPVTCFEYPWTHPKAPTDASVGTKRITLVHDSRQTHEGPIPPGHVFYTQIFSVFYHEVMGIWCMYPGVLNIFLPLEMHGDVKDRDHIWSVNASYQDLETGKTASAFKGPMTDYEKKCVGEFRSDITAVVQCCHALRAGAHFDEQRETSSSRRWKFDKKGVGGFTYHVLKLPMHARGPKPEPGLGTHASPRFHIRRAHIRKLSEDNFTFVRQCFVGDKQRGVVDKTYQVTP